MIALVFRAQMSYVCTVIIWFVFFATAFLLFLSSWSLSCSSKSLSNNLVLESKKKRAPNSCTCINRVYPCVHIQVVQMFVIAVYFQNELVRGRHIAFYFIVKAIFQAFLLNTLKNNSMLL